VETVRDLGEVDVWQESLQRSLARRGRLPRSSAELAQLRPARDLTDEDFMREYSAYWRMRREASAKRPLMPAIGVGGTLALLAATLPSLLGGKGGTRSERVAYVDHNARTLKRTLQTTKPAAPKQVSHLVLGAPAHPSVVETASVRPVTHLTVTAPAPQLVASTQQVASTQTPAAAATTTPAAATKPPASTKPTASPKPTTTTTDRARTTKRITPVHKATTLDMARNIIHKTTHPAVKAAVARSAASDVSATHSSRHPQGSGGAGLASGRRHTHSARPKTTHSPTSGTTDSSSHTSLSGGAGITGHRHTVSSQGYVNPLAHANVTPERIDQGVDYGGTGPLGALGAGKITYAGTTNTGWPGAYVEFRLSGGPDAGRYVYYAEGITLAQGLHVGEHIRAGQVIATMNGASTGIEIGWGAGVGTESYAMQQGQWGGNDDANSVATPSGKSFSALIASLGGPPGKVEG
jgi:hypothetical protein